MKSEKMAKLWTWVASGFWIWYAHRRFETFGQFEAFEGEVPAMRSGLRVRYDLSCFVLRARGEFGRGRAAGQP